MSHPPSPTDDRLMTERKNTEKYGTKKVKNEFNIEKTEINPKNI